MEGVEDAQVQPPEGTSSGASGESISPSVSAVSPRKAIRVVHPKSARRSGRRVRDRLKEVFGDSVLPVNLLSILAGLLGLAGLFLPWIHYSEAEYPQTWSEDYYRLGEFFSEVYRGHDSVFAFIAGMLVLGAVISFLSSVGGFFLLASAVSFMTAVNEDWAVLSAGFYVVLVGAILGILGFALKALTPIPRRALTVVGSLSGSGYSVNLLALASGLTGVASFFFAWVDYTGAMYYTEFHSTYSLYTLFYSPYWVDVAYTSAGFCFIVGSIACLLTPLGGIPQLSGAALFGYLVMTDIAYVQHFGPYRYRQSYDAAMGPGFWIGMTAGAIACASIVLAWRVRVDKAILRRMAVWHREVPRGTPTEASIATSGPRPGPEPSPRWTWWRAFKAIAAVAVVLAVLSSVLAAAFVLPYSDLEIWVWNGSTDQPANVALYVDGELIRGGECSYLAYFEADVSVTAGAHTVALDYGFPTGDPSTDVDGEVDWKTSVSAPALRKARVDVDIGYWPVSLPEATLNMTSSGDGFKLVISEMTKDLYWQDVTLVLTDGVEWVEWSPSTTSLATGSPAQYSFPGTSLGVLTVYCNVTDLAGNGGADIGDFFTLITGGDAGFSASVTYTAYMLYDPTSDAMTSVEFHGTE